MCKSAYLETAVRDVVADISTRYSESEDSLMGLVKENPKHKKRGRPFIAQDRAIFSNCAIITTVENILKWKPYAYCIRGERLYVETTGYYKNKVWTPIQIEKSDGSYEFMTGIIPGMRIRGKLKNYATNT